MSVTLIAHPLAPRPVRLLGKFTDELTSMLESAASSVQVETDSAESHFRSLSIVIEPSGYLLPFDEHSEREIKRQVQDAGLSSGISFYEVQIQPSSR